MFVDRWKIWVMRITQGLRDHNTRAQYEALKRRLKEIPEKKPHRKACEEILTLLEPDKYIGYQPYYAKQVKLSEDIANLEAFTKRLLDTSALVLKETPIPTGWMRPDEVLVQFDRLFIANGGYYLDVAQSVHKFKVAGLRLCELMRESDTATHGIHEHNFRMLSRLFVQLRELSSTLVEVGLEQGKK